MRVTLFGIQIDNISFEEAIDQVEKYLASDKTNALIDINAAKLILAQSNKDVLAALTQSEMVLADGMAIVWVSRLLRAPIKQRVAGCDLFQRIIAYGSNKDFRFFLLGAKQDVVFKVKQNFETKYPTIKIAGFRNGFFGIKDEQEIVDQINASEANVLFLGIPSPKTEEFVIRNKGKFKHVRFIEGVGGSFDIVAGVTKRAPHWMQKLGMEWFYRFLQEPGRMWKRYLVTNILFAGLVWREWLRQNLSCRIHLQ